MVPNKLITNNITAHTNHAQEIRYDFYNLTLLFTTILFDIICGCYGNTCRHKIDVCNKF